MPLPAAPSLSVPALIVVRPWYVLDPESVQVPAPVLVSVPLVVPRILASEPLPVPPSVRPNVLPVMVPALVMLMSPLPATMLLALANVINPL